MSDLVTSQTSREVKKKSNIWQNGSFLWLWSGTFFSNLTFYIYILAIPILLFQLTHSSLAMGTMRAVEFLPNLLLGMFIGVILDQRNRKRVMQVTVALQVVVLVVLIGLLKTHAIQSWELYIIGFALASFGFVFGNSYHSILPQIIPNEQLTSANSAMTFLNTIANMVGPAIAGWLLLSFSNSFSLMFTVIGYSILFIFISFLRLDDLSQMKNNSKNDRFGLTVREGWKQLVAIRSLWTLTQLILCINIASTFSGAVLVYYALQNLGISQSHLGSIFTSTAIGGLLSTLLAKRSRSWMKRGVLVMLAVGFAGIGQFVLFLSSSWYWLALGMFLMGFSTSFINIHYFTIRQETTPSHMLGRVVGTSSAIMKLATPISYVSGGTIGEFISVNHVFFISSMFLFAIILFCLKRGLAQIH